MIRQNDVDFMELNDGFIVQKAEKNYIPRGRLYVQKRPIADIVRMMLNNNDIFDLSDNYRTIGFYRFVVGIDAESITLMGYTIGQVKGTIRGLWEKAGKVYDGKVKGPEKKRFNECRQREEEIKIKKDKLYKMKSVKCNRFNLFNENIVLFKLRKANQKIK